ncbi:acyl-CoA dehydrogenase C-terminal domain-containing protein [Robiginitomaculum antarcticum]|uniref:acyl-CoA dehydrogenase C-terminal domain-containing protein n=1 Tax=Robiginitomaculum antarcticum TaxID=437507 RepID=UPI000361A9A7|nr:acyl-CoA dehydrogenase C-terminal domain-containing protein [Robiginitomaculum antarcticum]
MPIYNAPTRDQKFVMHEMLNAVQLSEYERFADVDTDLIDAVLEESAKFSTEVLTPLNVVGDHEGCVRHPDGSVTTPTGFKDAFKTMAENGWTALGHDPEYGGQGLPGILSIAAGEMQSAANMAFAMYPGLTNGAIKAISIGGSAEQKAAYLPKMVSCEWTGTMNLTEPHCGTDLGLLKTKAVPNSDGSYKISGQKIFISAGEHDMSDNIIHLVLARIEGAPEGVKGISLFIVPKFKLDADGNAGERNAVSCGSIEEKMGIHGNSTCVMNYDEAEGYMIGEENKGLRVMFVMMNRARVDVGMQGLAQSEVAYQNAAAYAKDRLQGRSLTGPKNEDGPADPIIVHPDVRRMLMETKAFNEGARALIYWATLLEDLENVHPDEKFREKCDDYLGLLTPVIKGYLTDKAMQTTIDCQQIFGGHGYIEEWGMSQFVRDTRIALIYEGANGIQALDLVGRKLARKGGRALMTLNAEIDAFLAENGDNDKLPDFMTGLKTAKGKLTEATMWLMQNGMTNPNNAGAGSVDYMHMMGLSTLAYMWAMMGVTAQKAIDNGSNEDFYANKIITGRYFMLRMLPMMDAHLAKIKTGAEPVMALDAAAF